MGADLVGGVPEADEDGNAHVDKVFALANEFGLGIDFHTDQVRASRPFALPHIAEKTIADGMQGMVMGSHCFALGHVPEDEHKQAIDLCAQAGVSICVTPYFSMRERVALPRQAGVNVSYMSDNIQDTWQPHGNGDMMLLAAFTARLTPFNTSQELAKSLGFDDRPGNGLDPRRGQVTRVRRRGWSCRRQARRPNSAGGPHRPRGRGKPSPTPVGNQGRTRSRLRWAPPRRRLVPGGWLVAGRRLVVAYPLRLRP